MNSPKPLTKKDILDALKESHVVTEEKLSDQFAEFYHGHIKPNMGAMEERLTNRIGKVESRLDNVETELREVKHEVKGFKEELSVTPSLRQFNELKEKVDVHLAAS